MTPKEQYNKALEMYLGDLGKKVVEWLNASTEDDEFYAQPVNIREQDKLLVTHAINMLDIMSRLSKSYFSKKNSKGEWEYKAAYTSEELAQVALLHVLANIGLLVKEKRNKKIDNKWVEVDVWSYDESRTAYGTRGEDAIVILKKIGVLSELSESVITAIMHCHEQYDSQTIAMYARIYQWNPLLLIAQTADKFETFINE